MKIFVMKWVTCYLAFIMFLIGIAPKVNAGFVPSETIPVALPDRAADLQKIQKILEMKIIKERLADFGFSESEIQERVNQLSDEEIHTLAQKIDQIKIGGNGLGIVIAVLVILILIVILLQLSGHRVIVT
ncbi:MAG: PA2779 family protein [Nitrospirota bacterium]